MKVKYNICAIIILIFTVSCFAEIKTGLIELPPGFSLEVYTDEVENARGMALGGDGTLYAGSRKSGNVYAILDVDNDYKPEKTVKILSGLTMPVGVDIYRGDLYVSEVSRILRIKDIRNNLIEPETEIISDRYPSDMAHGWKFIKIGPDNKLYVPVGAPCNVCYKENEAYATITRMNIDGSDFEIFAKGVRNTVGFDWHPETGILWFTDNGRDRMGDNKPPDELNKAEKSGLHFGFPFMHGTSIRDPEYWDYYTKEMKLRVPEAELGPHVAALGMRFYTGDMFPNEYKNDIFIAEHGSWNRSSKIGYRITRVKLKKNKAVSYKVFASGWKQGESAWGRPVDVQVARDGSMFISDDKAGAIYRIVYEK